MSIYRQYLEDWLKTLDVKAERVLDIGGKQLPVMGRTKSWEVSEYKILDLPEFDLNNYSQEFTIDGDIIFCLEVFEYLINPLAGLKNIEMCLKENAKAYVTFAFAYPHHNELELDSLRYTESGIRLLAKKARLRITNTWYRRDKSGLLEQFYRADGMHPSKDYPNHDVTGFIVEFSK